jgi:hypothetical protein
MTKSSHRLAGAFLSLATIAAPAQGLALEPVSDPLLRQLQQPNIDNRDRRLDFQLRQQLNREEDSRIARDPPRINVPIMRPSCRPQTFGNNYIVRNCR